jgi:hypothetical protein
VNARTRTIVFVLAVGALVGAMPAGADPPIRVGRLNLVEGAVSFEPGEMDGWSPAILNYPLTTGDSVWTDRDGRAEIHVGSTAIRLDADTSFSFLNLDDDTLQASVTQGTVSIRVRDLSPGEVVEIDTPNASVTLLSEGSYRIDVPDGSSTALAVRSGEAELGTGRSSLKLAAGRYALLRGTGTVSITLGGIPSEDSWDLWCLARDRNEDDLVCARYVPRDLIGCEDLDRYGTWEVTVQYGPVWTPRSVGSRWAPYRDGRWAWIPPWGWTWIDDEPWGFAPFHYGRWAFFKGRWVWVPGMLVSRPVYAPALVVFIGGDSWSISVSVGGGIGWFPLAPHEPYVPPFAAGSSYVRNINASHVQNFDPRTIEGRPMDYTNRRIPEAVTVVPDRDFTTSKPVARAAVNVPEHQLQAAPVQGMHAPAAPQVTGRSVVKQLTPPPRPAPFEQRQQQPPASPSGGHGGPQVQNRSESAPGTSQQAAAARTQALALIASVRRQLEEAQQKVSRAQRTSPNAQAASNLLAQARSLLAEADRKAASGDYASAVQKANAAAADVSRANATIAASSAKEPRTGTGR